MKQRKPLRLRNYDYSLDGMYFLTICVKEKQCVLWDDDGRLSDIGQIVDYAICNIETTYDDVTVHNYVVMPNHVHILLSLSDDRRDTGGRSLIAPTISRVVRLMKGAVTKLAGFSIWQKSFYDRIVRNEREYAKIWEYIDTNPAKWQEDQYFANTNPKQPFAFM